MKNLMIQRRITLTIDNTSNKIETNESSNKKEEFNLHTNNRQKNLLNLPLDWLKEKQILRKKADNSDTMEYSQTPTQSNIEDLSFKKATVKLECPNGGHCGYSGNKEHVEQYLHPCKYGVACRNQDNSVHTQRFSHPSSRSTRSQRSPYPYCNHRSSTLLTNCTANHHNLT